MPDQFNRESYRKLIVGLQERDYSFCRFEEAVPTKRQVVLRHDLDFCIDRAVDIASLEASLGVQSHHFVLLRSELYNPLSASGRDGLKRILSMGHRVGLHFDASLYPDGHDLDAAARHECSLLGMVLDTPVDFISFHRPAPSLLGSDEPLAGCQHAYQTRYFKNLGYCSDSRGGWHHGHPLDHESIARGHAIQLLTHPIWWTGDEQRDPVSTLDGYLKTRCDFLCSEVERNCEPYRGHGSLRSLGARIFAE